MDKEAITRKSLVDRLIAWVTLVDLPAWAAVLAIAGSIGVSWLAAFYLGGGTNVAPHWFYVPVFLAGLRFGWLGALMAGAVSMFVAGPLLPADSATGAPQLLSDWVSRGIFFILIGQFVTGLFGGVRRLSRQETLLAAEVELGATELATREARFSALVQNSSDLVMIVDPAATVLFQSPSVERVLGWDPEGTLGTPFVTAIHDSDQEHWRTLVDFLSADFGHERVVEWRVRHHDGSWRFLQTLVTNLLDEPSVGGLVLNSRDITEQKALEEQLRHQAFHDELTGLANRALFSEQLEQAVRRRSRIGAGLALLFIDLDAFKAVNDLHGHGLGDNLLKQVAERLKAALRDADTVARLGGDEFAVLFEGVGVDSRPRAAVTRLLESLAEPFQIGSAEVLVTASVGMVLDDSGGESAEDLLRNADLAMYAAKTKNRGGYEVFSSAMHSIILERMQVASELQRALDQDEFQVYFQPIVDGTGTIDGAEALIRWNHPERGLVLPGEFIPVAETSQIIVAIGNWMLHHACQEFAAATRAAADGERISLSVNLSTRQLNDPALPDTIASALANARLNAARLTLEITESTIMENIASTIRVLTQLRNTGVKIAIDDFGTGYSSLSLLSEIPLDTLKIDRSFVTDIAKRSEPAQTIRAILRLAADLGLHTVAEGVEELDQHQLLQKLGCKASQGFYFARPQPAAQFLELMQQDPQIPHGDPNASESLGRPAPSQARLPVVG
jgi:diguanylate cyclase (GGDEF)-like protein/PAS domain S-box-containing protein